MTPWSRPADLALNLDGTPMAVRHGLDDVLAHPVLADVSDDARGSLWTVLAEVLNNVVEHAYRSDPGPIDLVLRRHGPRLAIEVVDKGAPMPGLELPPGQLTDPAECDSLPEGGFGWFLIRAMTDGLVYDRIGAENRLRFCMNCA